MYKHNLYIYIYIYIYLKGFAPWRLAAGGLAGWLGWLAGFLAGQKNEFGASFWRLLGSLGLTLGAFGLTFGNLLGA